jgi:two-component system sensor histidine kinase FlrB
MSRTQAALAHQIRSPLTAAGLSVDYLLLTVEDAEEHARLERVRRSLASIEQLLRNALVFARGELTERQDFPVEALVGGLREAVAGIAPRARIEWRETFTTDDRISGDLAALVSALLNLVENTLAVGGMDVPISVTARAAADSLEIEIADRGPGMSAELLARAKEPFFSGRAGGTGLGLSITDAVVRAHGGRFDLESVPGEGVSARIVLPLLAPLGAGAGR